MHKSTARPLTFDRGIATTPLRAISTIPYLNIPIGIKHGNVSWGHPIWRMLNPDGACTLHSRSSQFDHGIDPLGPRC